MLDNASIGIAVNWLFEAFDLVVTKSDRISLTVFNLMVGNDTIVSLNALTMDLSTW